MRAEVYLDEPINWSCLANLALIDSQNKPFVGVVNGELAVKLSLIHGVDSEQDISTAVNEVFAMYGRTRYRLTFFKTQHEEDRERRLAMMDVKTMTDRELGDAWCDIVKYIKHGEEKVVLRYQEIVAEQNRRSGSIATELQ